MNKESVETKEVKRAPAKKVPEKQKKTKVEIDLEKRRQKARSERIRRAQTNLTKFVREEKEVDLEKLEDLSEGNRFILNNLKASEKKKRFIVTYWRSWNKTKTSWTPEKQSWNHTLRPLVGLILVAILASGLFFENLRTLNIVTMGVIGFTCVYLAMMHIMMICVGLSLLRGNTLEEKEKVFDPNYLIRILERNSWTDFGYWVDTTCLAIILAWHGVFWLATIVILTQALYTRGGEILVEVFKDVLEDIKKKIEEVNVASVAEGISAGAAKLPTGHDSLGPQSLSEAVDDIHP